ncbi:MAG: crosslink repair DNA glycosylase YcaQ family protein [Anaerolineales bacterium]|jgi:hypothetical protein
MPRKPTLQSRLAAYRAQTYSTAPGHGLSSLDDAVRFINARGLATLWPVKGIDLPSLWTAVAGNRPVADAHDDPGHITWRWKDQLLDQRRVYYGKLLRGRATFASLELLPYLYAMSPRVADLDDYKLAYDAGHLTHEAKLIGDALLREGPLHTIDLRRLAHQSSDSAKSGFERALTYLQRGLWVVPIGVAEAGAWRYAFIYELFDRWFDQIPSLARPIKVREAREQIVATCLRASGAASEGDLARTLSWPIAEIRKTVQRLAEREAVFADEELGWVIREAKEYAR